MQGRKKKTSSSIYCGVFKTPYKTYLAKISYHSKSIWLGIYKEEKDAAIAYDIKAFELFREGARLNFPDMAGKLINPIKTTDSKSSKYKGISLANSKYWVATAFVNGKKHYLGNFKSEEEAYRARCSFLEQFNT